MTERPAVPLSLALQQGPMLRTLARMALQDLRPNRRPAANPATFSPATMVVPAPSPKLVRCYRAWSGAPDRPGDAMPPHLFSQWALPAAIRVLQQTRYRLARIVNQGVSMRVDADLPTGRDLVVSARLASLEETDTRARVAIEILSGPREKPDAVTGTMHVVFPLGRRDRKPVSDAHTPIDWRTVGHWQASADDGFRFALLTGDFNPIHWIGLAGRRSPFKQTVLQGFGMFVRSHELLARTVPIREIDVRFLNPVPLPSPPLRLQDAPPDADGWKPLRLIGPTDQLHMAGRYRPR